MDVSGVEKWDASKITNFSDILILAHQLKNWDVSDGTDFSDMLYKCTSLSSLSEYENWKVNKAKTLCGMLWTFL